MPSVNRGSFKHFCRFMNRFVLKINTGHVITGKHKTPERQGKREC